MSDALTIRNQQMASTVRRVWCALTSPLLYVVPACVGVMALAAIGEDRAPVSLRSTGARLSITANYAW